MTAYSATFSLQSGGVFSLHCILMYPDVFWCILRKYCILVYSHVFSNVFSYPVVCDRDTLYRLPSVRARSVSVSEWRAGYRKRHLYWCILHCILLVSCLYRVRILYLDFMQPSCGKIRLYSHRTCCILIVSESFPTRARRYIRNTLEYIGIHQDTV